MADSRETVLPKAFVTGWPIKHSRSPIIHRYWLKQHSLAGTYDAVAVAEKDFATFITSLKDGTSGFRGGNVTIPHKETAFRLSDCPDELAKELGAANTLWVEEGRVYATNTDGYGFATNLDDINAGWDRTERAVILGAGGASRAVVQAVRDRGIGEIHVVNRTPSRAQELADRFGPKVHAHALPALSEVMTGAGLFINTTSLGMDGEESADFDFSPLRSGALVTDIVYVPLETPILKQAREQGFATADGLGMLLHQAAPGFEKWFGIRPAVDETLRAMIVKDIQAAP
ncbi:shikimate dehydrogenase [Aliirhizobium terrae]|uniref:shikimate dehydrogenase n=1 Tax=Terrirhizobium terrae TaxID=2926709 RepID=UPI002575741F|nr:shikimate dehydrogenase [Rhizobium sp. CC-CFT758]WJH41644.1 shikimate dehydrogenase [Rhizobium sp. CC-CFT758]